MWNEPQNWLSCTIMTTFTKTILSLIICLLCLFSVGHGAERNKIFFRESFAHLENWRPVFFPKIKQHSTYRHEIQGGITSLRAESLGSASAIVYRKTFSVYDYPEIRWQWRVMNIYRKGDMRTKAGDDYPLRVYILFQYDPKTAGVMDRIKYGLTKMVYGEYPPHSAISYVWANRTEERGLIVPSPYTPRAVMIAIQGGDTHLGSWQDEQVNVVADYRKVFGINPPSVCTIGVMNDSDNTGESAVSYIRFIEVFSTAKRFLQTK